MPHLLPHLGGGLRLADARQLSGFYGRVAGAPVAHLQLGESILNHAPARKSTMELGAGHEGQV